MNLDLPDHAQVLIFVGDRQALPSIGAMLPPAAASDETPAPRGGRPKLKMLGAAALVGLAFVYGQHQGLHRASFDLASNAVATPSAPQPSALPASPPSGRPLPSPAAAPGAPDQVPAAFAQQLQQQPTVTPPPGAPPAGAPAGPRAFGLEE